MTTKITKPTKMAVLGKFRDDQKLDIWQIADASGKVISSMNYLGILNPTFVPVVQDSHLAINTNVPQNVVNTVDQTGLFHVALVMQSYGDGAHKDTCVATITWTDAQNTVNTKTLSLDGHTKDSQQLTHFFIALSGSAVSIVTAFSQAAFHYDLAIGVQIVSTFPD